MSRKFVFPLLLATIFMASACNLTNSTSPSDLATGTSIIATLPVSTSTGFPTETPTSPVILPTVTDTALPVSTATVPGTGSSTYIDDRSTPSQVLISFYNAINRQEYSRAYGYWSNPASTLGNFANFSNGYANTVSVDLVFGQISGDAGAGQYYYTVPVILKAAEKGGHTNYAACYVVHQSNPSNYGAPPIQPMSIDRGQASVSPAGTSDSAALASACTGYPAGGNSVPAAAESLNIDKNNFIDNRSGPIETVSSLLNAVNLKQYVRAYSYFQDPATFPGAYDAYAAGYANTDTITVTFGAVTNEGAAGSIYYNVPLAIKVLQTSSTTQTFVGCYTLRLSQPGLQSVPPFKSLGITTGKFNLVDNNSDLTALLPTACQ
jgi:hypothetical protein